MTRIYIILALAIAAEVVATSALRASEQFTRLWPSLVVIGGYMAAFYGLSMAVRVIPTGIVYAVWSGLGIVLVALVGLFLGQKLDLPAAIGIAMILGGVLVINLFSAAAGH
ncbi:MAG: QacE family quaternary ammonium compound efflux SMR transporter [Rubellimicrobium sp.]|nr:QacE family quaternary ammonium compound efflux SMR transporter [Rubellimicrobium sp.]